MLSALLACIACGSDDPAPSNGQAGSSASAPTALTDATAGKACTTNGDCGTGTCRTAFTGTQLLGSTTIEAPGGYCSFACVASNQCGGGSCVGGSAGGLFGMGASQGGGGWCLARCTGPDDCREGYRCLDTLSGQTLTGESGASGTCQVAPETTRLTGSVVGNACASAEDCSGGDCLTSEFGVTYPGGFCTGSCLGDGDCGDDAKCDPGALGAPGRCYRVCEADGDCGREGYRCRPGLNDAPKRCQPGMEPLPDGIVGSACTADADCGGAAMSCTTQTSIFGMTTAYPGGYCSGRCVENVDCGSGASCVGGLGGITSTATGTCYQSCTANTDCREGYDCRAPAAFGGVGGAPTVTVCRPIAPEEPGDAGVSPPDGGAATPDAAAAGGDAGAP
ncbi:MAG: hypothetical protein ABW321_04255 [Polyangiales bacterium]